MSRDPRMDIDIHVRKQGQGDHDAQQGLDNVKTAANQAKQELDAITPPDLQGVGDEANKAAEDLREVGKAIEESGASAGMADKSYSDFTNTIFGLQQLRSDDITMQFRGVGNALNGLSRAAGLPLGPLSAYAGVFAAASAGVALFMKLWEEESPEVIEAMKRLNETTGETIDRLNDLDNVEPNFDGIMQNLDSLRDAYAALREETDRDFQNQQRLQSAQDKLDRAELTFAREQAVASAPTPEAAEALLAIYAEHDRQLGIEQENSAILRNRRHAEERLEQVTAQRADIAERIAQMEEKVEQARQNTQDNVSRVRGQALGIYNLAPQVRSVMQERAAEHDLQAGEIKNEKKIKELQALASELETEIASLGIELQAASVSAQAVDFSAIPIVTSALSSITDLMSAQSAVVESARQSGDNQALQQAMDTMRNLEQWQKSFSEMGSGSAGQSSIDPSAITGNLETMQQVAQAFAEYDPVDADKEALLGNLRSLLEAGADISAHLDAFGLTMEDVTSDLSGIGDTLDDAASGISAGAESVSGEADAAAATHRAAGERVGAAYREGAQEAVVGAEIAGGTVRAAGENFSTACRRSADLIERETDAAAGRIGSSLDRMAGGIERFGSRTLENLDLLNLRLNALEADLMRTAATTEINRMQISNL